MAARTIVTLHPDVECDLCGRRLLRGERPDVFLGGGQRRMVCELCTPRAAYEGWRREVDGQSASTLGERPQRGRSLLGRLRQLREPAREPEAAGAANGRGDGLHGSVPREARRVRARPHGERRAKIEPEWTALDEQWDELGAPPVAADPSGEDLAAAEASAPAAELPATEAFAVVDILDAEGALPAADAYPESAGVADTSAANAESGLRDVSRALEIFNGGETPRRIAGIARALGEACVHVMADPERESVVAIVAAWELCWYRYEIDLEDATGAVRVAAEGTELEELPAEQRIANAVADEHGALALLAA